MIYLFLATAQRRYVYLYLFIFNNLQTSSAPSRLCVTFHSLATAQRRYLLVGPFIFNNHQPHSAPLRLCESFFLHASRRCGGGSEPYISHTYITGTDSGRCRGSALIGNGAGDDKFAFCYAADHKRSILIYPDQWIVVRSGTGAEGKLRKVDICKASSAAAKH